MSPSLQTIFRTIRIKKYKIEGISLPAKARGTRLAFGELWRAKGWQNRSLHHFIQVTGNGTLPTLQLGLHDHSFRLFSADWGLEVASWSIVLTVVMDVILNILDILNILNILDILDILSTVGSEPVEENRAFLMHEANTKPHVGVESTCQTTANNIMKNAFFFVNFVFLLQPFFVGKLLPPPEDENKIQTRPTGPTSSTVGTLKAHTYLLWPSPEKPHGMYQL